MAITTTEATRAQYRKRARQLKEQLARRHGCPVDEISPMALVEDLLSKKEMHESNTLTASIEIALAPTPNAALQGPSWDGVPRSNVCISKATFRMYRASLRQYLLRCN
ncbi:hypothetical protein [Lysobacter sp. D1-1-M9]|uniref:hypothetical protein n=1 Tax=Novilysobacter longmucuonensis TaxID=3098603 RepID=UPI002FCC2E27